MIVIGVRDKDADDIELLHIQRPYPVVRPAFELCFGLYPDGLPREVLDHIVNLFTYQENGAAALFS